MSYKKTADLPGGVKDNLSGHAQGIYEEAFNSAGEQYEEESRAHQVAPAVEQKYEKNDNDYWVSKEE